MNFLPTLSAWPFALAGLACAAGPIIIHLLNRRRPKQVRWAAMDFLREALQRHRRMIQTRDLLLLLLRVAAVVLFGLALARPYFTSSNQRYDGTQPLHAVLLIDNSLSMGYQTVGGTLLDDARTRAREFIDRLPRGSQITVVPLCGSSRAMTLDPFFAKEDALEALGRIEVVDRGVSLRAALNLARKACESAPELAKRVVLISDQQGQNWVDVDPAALAELPPLQVVSVNSDRRENTWIENVRVAGDVAALNLEASLIVEVMHQGEGPRRDLPVTLWVEGRPAATQTITVSPGEGARQVVFQHVFADYQPAPDRPAFVPVHATIAPDQLPEDDQRFAIVPVVAELPVVFVDQYADDEEDRNLQRFGETRWLRTLLGEATRPDPTLPPLVKVRHVRIDQLERDLIADARLVVVAGVRNPAEKVELLREYVEQGGQLLLAAGGDFDPAAWNESAWRDGAGILPGPLQRELVGVLPELATGTLQPYQLVFDSLRDELFGVPSMSREDLKDLYDEPLFFQLADVDVRDEVLAALRASEREWLESQFGDATSAVGDGGQKAGGGAGRASDSPTAQPTAQKSANDAERPAWLRWRGGHAPAGNLAELEGEARKLELERQVEARLPRVLARVSTAQRTPLLIDRRVGEGRVVLMTSGIFSSWNTLPSSSAMFVLEKLSREMIASTLPPVQFPTLDAIKIALPEVDPESRVELHRPDQPGRPMPLDFGFIDPQRRGVTLNSGLMRGIYRITVSSASDANAGVGATTTTATTTTATDGEVNAAAAVDGAGAASKAVREIALALNGPSRESDLSPIPASRLEKLEESPQLRWLASGESISLEGAQLRGQGSWWYLAFIVLIALIGEQFILGRMATQRAA